MKVIVILKLMKWNINSNEILLVIVLLIIMCNINDIINVMKW